ncbi:MAG: glycosyltransferase [Candidatus Omnitrophota bacterium]
MTVSIIIAAKTWQKNLEECVGKCLGLDFEGFEILALPDESPKQPPVFKGERGIPVSIIPTGAVNPARKRDIGMARAKGEVLAFIDDDAYPAAPWLKKAVLNFADENIAAVGGPAVTPDDDTVRQKASGRVFSSPIVSGKFIYRYIPKKKAEANDLPSCNLLVRKSVMEELGGFNTDFWPGEDTKLCFDITHKLGKKIIYDPDVLVYHHRRKVFLPHLRQVANYALHRGYFIKKFPANSLRPAYFAPSLFFILLFVGGVISLFSPFSRALYFSGLFLYLSVVFIFSLSGNLRLMPYVATGTILTHIAYGIYFLKGILSGKLSEENS